METEDGLEGSPGMETDDTIGYQEGRGWVHKWCEDEGCVVFAEGWPSWAFALDALGCKDIQTLARFKTPQEREEFRATSLGTSRVSMTQLKKRWKEREVCPHVFIQGSEEFSGQSRALCEDLDAASITELVAGRSMGGKSDVLETGRPVSHRRVGGVTTGEWRVISTHKFLDWKLPKIKKVLKHVLKTTEVGRKLERTSMDLARRSNAFLPVARVRFGVKEIKVHCTCVITQGLVERDLTMGELMDVYDIELETQRQLKMFWAETGTNPSRSFTQQVPVKVLIAVGRNLFKKPEVMEEACDHASEASQGGPRMEEIRVPNQDRSKPTVKAVKSDDAEVDINAWDIWNVDSFSIEHPEVCPKICRQGTWGGQHTQLFDALRKLCFRRCLRNAFKGFCKYMNEEHKDLGLWEEEVHLRGPSFGTSVHLCAKGWTTQARFGSRKREHTGKGGKEQTKSDVRKKSLERDLRVGADALERLNRSDWWSWKDGSTLMFWRWPERYRYSVRDGNKLFIRRRYLPHYFAKQRWPIDSNHRDKCKEKIVDVRRKRYVQEGKVESLTGFFAVPKGDKDIRMVYDATKCGLNSALWSPNFGLPTIDSVLRNADESTWFGDIDLGEMFLNYFLDEDLRSFAGLDLKEEFEDIVRYERWERALMGLRPSPYVCTQTFSWSAECIRGDRRDPENPLRWDNIVLNLPGDLEYKPWMPWVYRWDMLHQRLASFFESYVDDIRTGAASESLAWKTSRRVASWTNYLGQQDAPRKRRPPSQTPGAWAGAMCLAKPDMGLFVTCSEEKWLKGKKWVDTWWKEVVEGDGRDIGFKDLERGCGFLVYLSRTFPAIFPYLKGVYNTMNSWRVGRDGEGWKYTMKEWKLFLDMESEKMDEVGKARRKFVLEKQTGRPERVKVVPRLRDDLNALRALFSGEVPQQRLVRGKALTFVLYGFGDASGGGFGSSWETAQGVRYRYGTWGRDEEDASSNFRELKNLVETLEVMAQEGNLAGHEIFMFTDNSTAEAAFYNGSSSSKLLYDLVLQLRKLEMREKCKIWLTHVAGTRMIAQGSDGLSRSNLTEGVMKGSSMLGFIPINKSALERSAVLKPWIESWIVDEVEYLEPKDWFCRGQDLVEGEFEFNAEGRKLPKGRQGIYIWSPAPAAGEVALEALRSARQKGQVSTHLILIPNLMQPLWRRLLYKAADLVLKLPAGHPAWPSDMHESLTIAFCFPYLRCEPWELKRSPPILELGERVSRMWRDSDWNEGPLLRELWDFPKRLGDLSESMAWEVLYRRRKL